MNHYRDPLVGLKSQLATKRAALDACERTLTPVLRALLPERLARTIRELAERREPASETLEALSDADASLDALIAAYDEVLVGAPHLRACADEIPDPAPPYEQPPWLLEEPFLLEIRRALRVRMEQIAAGALVSRFGDFAYVSRFEIVHAPYSLVLRAQAMPDDMRIARYDAFLRTSVPTALPALVVQRERVHHAVGKALHVAHDIELGEPAFDGDFWITGAEATTAVLTPEVRDALERLSDRTPLLLLRDGLATLSWTGHWRNDANEAVPDEALDVLVGIRAAIETG